MEIRVIPGFPLYGASADGRIWSLQSGTWTELTQSINGKYGYWKVNLLNGRQCTKKVHSLVALCFLGPRPAGQDVNHIDGVKSHNAVVNLEYCTRSHNVKHAYAMGLMTAKRRPAATPRHRQRLRRPTQPKLIYQRVCGEQSNRSKLSAHDVEIIRIERANGVMGKELAVRFGVSAAQISRICLGRKWRHLDLKRPRYFDGAAPIEGNSMGTCSPGACADFGGLV